MSRFEIVDEFGECIEYGWAAGQHKRPVEGRVKLEYGRTAFNDAQSVFKEIGANSTPFDQVDYVAERAASLLMKSR